MISIVTARSLRPILEKPAINFAYKRCAFKLLPFIYTVRRNNFFDSGQDIIQFRIMLSHDDFSL